MGLLNVLWQKIRKLAKWPDTKYKFRHVQESPDLYKRKTVYLFGQPNSEWLAELQCPCGCSKKIELILLQEESPHWNLIKHQDGTVSFRPSIWRTTGCKSHFFLTKGKIIWCS